MKQLPDKVHELLRVALDDLDEVKKLPNVKADMRHWVMPCDDGTCHVCLAGAVMLNSLDCPIPKADGYSPLNMIQNNQGLIDKLYALDDLRSGYLFGALSCLNLPGVYRGDVANFFDRFEVTPHSENEEIWRQDMEQMYLKLKEFDI